MANVAQEIVDVHESNEEKEYVDLDTVGQSAGVWDVIVLTEKQNLLICIDLSKY